MPFGGWERFVALRHLKAKKSGVLTVFTILSMMGVLVSSCSLSVVISIMGGFGNDLKEKIVANNAHVVVDRPGGTLEHADRLARQISKIDGVRGAMPYVTGEVMLSSQTNYNGVLLKGIDPDRIDRVIELSTHLSSGSLDLLRHPEKNTGGARVEISAPRTPQRPPGRDAGPTPDPVPDGQDDDPFLRPTRRDPLPGVIIGRELAKDLRLYVGDEVSIVSPLGDLGPTGPVPKSRPFRVAAIFYSGMYEFDTKYAYVVLPVAQRFLSLGDAVTGVEASVTDIDQVDTQTDAIRRLAPRELRVRSWKELNQSLFSALQLEKVAMFVVLSLAILIGSFCIVATLLLMVIEKGQEIAVLKSMGATDASVMNVFMIEGLIIGVAGTTIGVCLGALVCTGLRRFGVHLDPEVYYIDKLPIHMEPVEFLAVAGAAIVMSFLATLYPARMASRQSPVEGLRHE